MRLCALQAMLMSTLLLSLSFFVSLYLVKDVSKPFAHVDIVERDREGLEHLADTERKRT